MDLHDVGSYILYCNGEFNKMRVRGVALNILLVFPVKDFQGKFLSTMLD
jgi:hypothetical protein